MNCTVFLGLIECTLTRYDKLKNYLKKDYTLAVEINYSYHLVTAYFSALFGKISEILCFCTLCIMEVMFVNDKRDINYYLMLKRS